jgi:hypothetical protein
MCGHSFRAIQESRNGGWADCLKERAILQVNHRLENLIKDSSEDLQRTKDYQSTPHSDEGD